MLGVGGPRICLCWGILSNRGFGPIVVFRLKSSFRTLPRRSEKLIGR